MKHNKDKKSPKTDKNPEEDQIRLNKYIANSGVCSRREADTLISEGKVTVNDKVITELGFKVTKYDKVTVGGKKIEPKNFIYILLNKPKDYLSTTSDPQERKTVMDLIKDATKERVYPVGRLDRNTTGLLILTNDGDLTHNLIHPSHNIEKIYAAELDKPLTKNDFIRIMEGVELEDGIAEVDEVAYTDEKDKTKVGIRLHSGRNRIIRRIFETLGYEVKKLDRVMIGMLTKKDLPRGKWRFLTPKEVRIFKSKIKK